MSFKFDVSEIPSSEILIQSELKVLMKPDKFGIKPARHGFFRVTVFGVLPRNKKENKGHDNEEHKKKKYPALWRISSKIIPVIKGQEEHWVTIDVSTFANYIINIQRKHMKLVLKVEPLGGTTINPTLLGINNHVKFETEKGLLVIYSGDDEKPLLKKNKSRSRRDVSSQQSSQTKKQRRKNRRKNKKGKRTRGRKKACRRKNMVVEFDKFGWSNFLIQPTKHNLHYCHGNCNYPLPQSVTTSNHATIQSIWHEMNSSTVPAPCCVPDEFDVLPVLSLDGNDRVVFKMKEGLIVKSCACR